VLLHCFFAHKCEVHTGLFFLSFFFFSFADCHTLLSVPPSRVASVASPHRHVPPSPSPCHAFVTHRPCHVAHLPRVVPVTYPLCDVPLTPCHIALMCRLPSFATCCAHASRLRHVWVLSHCAALATSDTRGGAYVE
jgi:hypothetical protein